jgi:hypothetical protein
MINSASTTTDFRPDDNADTPGGISDDHDMSEEEEEEEDDEDSDVEDVDNGEEEEDGYDESEDTELSKIEIRLPSAFLLNTSP